MTDLTSLLTLSDINERCGLIVNDEIVEVTNVHPDPTKGFRANPEELIKLAGIASAMWHTHPNADPAMSEEDYFGFSQWPNLVHHIVGVRDGNPAIESYTILDGLVIKS